ncbi:class I mannose-6-phosphate isomerase [Agromyces marinus]|uniref:class I mannose-6-phosphate isomerase n=1 Tax=Agromyces marinus TaxID=1389020 RepID=UPI001F3562FE|nr:class I mannose-6-phosphate isomerase [Agromyces marinus]UIP59239.1 hypothetical protein DSM26151_21400 [Agromyces marinus]
MTIENASPIDLAAAGIQLDANQIPARFYRGGDRIAAFRRTGRAEPYTPEDWVASTTSAFGSADLGLSRLPGGEFLIDAIRRDPEFWLGAAHRASFDSDSMLLVKLLDAGERLPIHVHPDGAFASEHLRAPHGKAEAWYILTPGVIRLGLKRDISRIELERAVAEHDGRTLLELTHEREVAAGDTVFVPPGTLHAIGGGILLVEVQEPSDFSILLEWKGFAIDGDRHGHLGLGFDVALDAVDTGGRSSDEIDALIRRTPGPGSVLPPSALDYFRLDRTSGLATFDAGFSVVITLDGTATLSTDRSEQRLEPGSTTLIPHAAGRFEVTGECLIARPPLPR